MTTPRIAATAALIAALACPALATATYPGQRDGRLAYAISTQHGNVDIYSVAPSGRGKRRLTKASSFDACPGFSADGRTLVFCSDRTGSFQIWAMGADGADQRALTDLPGGALFPDAAPDNEHFAFMGSLDGKRNDIYVGSLAGGAPQPLTDSANNTYPAWSPDGSRIAFISDRTGVNQVYVMHADGSHVKRLTGGDVTHEQLPEWSPDGRSIAYEQGKFGKGEIWIMRADGRHKTQLTSGADDFGPAFSPDGAQIAFVRQLAAKGKRPVMVMDADGSHLHRLPKSANQLDFVPAWQAR